MADLAAPGGNHGLGGAGILSQARERLRLGLRWTREAGLGEASALRPDVARSVDRIAGGFHRFERQAHRLQWFVLALAAAVALLPASLYLGLQVGHLRAHAEREGGRFARRMAARVARGADAAALSAWLSQEVEPHGLAAFELFGGDGRPLFRVGRPARPLLPVARTVRLSASVAPFTELRVEADDRPLLGQTARLFALHLVVAGFLALVYRVPIRAFRTAVAEVEHTYAQLVHSDRLSAVGETYAGLAHEINNPLGIILSRTRILLGNARERGLPPELVRDVEMIERHGNRIAEIVRSLLAFARKARFELTETDLNAVVRDALGLVERPFAKHAIRIEPRLDPALPPLRASPDQLQQVFVNLLNNARDAMPGGGTITVRTYRDGDRVVAEVRDTGAGIAPDIRHRIFEPFFTTKGVGKGTGLGLTVSHGIVRTHGGEIGVESVPGQGAVFRVMLPAGGRRR